MTESLGFRESMKEANIKSKLDKTEKAYWDNLPISEKDNLSNFINMIKTIVFQLLLQKLKKLIRHMKMLCKSKNDKILQDTRYWWTYWDNKKAFDKQSIFANFDNFYHAMGQFTFNMEKQAKYNYYMSQQKQNFIQIAQLDTLIKQ